MTRPGDDGIIKLMCDVIEKEGEIGFHNGKHANFSFNLKNTIACTTIASLKGIVLAVPN